MRRFYSTIGLAFCLSVSFQAVGCAGPTDEVSQKDEQQEVVKGIEDVKAPAIKVEEKEIKVAATDGEPVPDKDGKYKEDGKYFDKDDNPIYNKTADGKWDWLTYNGNRRYHAECHVCHGPHGLGSSFAPALADSLKTLTYEQFQDVVTNGRTVHQPGGTESVMPSFGTNKNVMCFLDDFYVYLKARADGAMPRVTHNGLPKESKSKEIREEEEACFGN